MKDGERLSAPCAYSAKYAATVGLSPQTQTFVMLPTPLAFEPFFSPLNDMLHTHPT